MNSDTAVNILIDVVQDQSGKKYDMDHVATRFPTNVLDIARFLVVLTSESPTLDHRGALTTTLQKSPHHQRVRMVRPRQVASLVPSRVRPVLDQVAFRSPLSFTSLHRSPLPSTRCASSLRRSLICPLTIFSLLLRCRKVCIYLTRVGGVV
jgi:hypothetical protein